MNQFSSPFQNKSTVFICIYSLGVLALLPHTHFYNSLKHQRSRRYPYSSTSFAKVKDNHFHAHLVK